MPSFSEAAITLNITLESHVAIVIATDKRPGAMVMLGSDIHRLIDNWSRRKGFDISTRLRVSGEVGEQEAGPSPSKVGLGCLLFSEGNGVILKPLEHHGS